MTRIIVLMLCCMFGISQVSCGQKILNVPNTVEDIKNVEEGEEKVVEEPRTKEEIKAMVKEVFETPTEYDIPKETLDRLLLRDNAMKNAQMQVEKKTLELELASTKLAFKKLEYQRTKEAFSAEFRLFLASTYEGKNVVPYDDLPNWKIENNKAIWVKPK